jgi:hypothetical protein
MKLTHTDTRAVAALLTDVLQSFVVTPKLTGEALVKQLGRERRHFDRSALTAYIKLCGDA